MADTTSTSTSTTGAPAGGLSPAPGGAEAMRMRRHHESNVPASADDLRQSLEHLLAWLAGRGAPIDTAYALLLSFDPSARHAGVRAVLAARDAERTRAGKRPAVGRATASAPLGPAATAPEAAAPVRAPSGGTPVTALDELTALRLAVFDCEGRARPVTAHTLRSVEDPNYHGFRRRRQLLRWMIFLVVVCVLAAIGLDGAFAYLGAVAPEGSNAAAGGAPPGARADSEGAPTMAAVASVSMPPRGAADPGGGPAAREGLRDAKQSAAEKFLLRPLFQASAFLFWGLVGASFYLLRRMYVYTKQRTFEPSLVGNYYVRWIMGGIAGFLAAMLAVNTRGDELGAFQVSAVAVAAGFSVRLVYSLMEKLIHELIDKFNLDVTRDAPLHAAPVRSPAAAANGTPGAVAGAAAAALSATAAAATLAAGATHTPGDEGSPEAPELALPDDPNDTF
ncbi:MAG TPA: hypothetical protein VG389_01645 [Myxococcota bacterium]|jgi:hypothetical protein|nr:hypothetical protein [Myxococcota bacterium]